MPLEEAHRALGADLHAIEYELEHLEAGAGAQRAATGAVASSSRESVYSRACDLGERLRWTLWLGDVTSGELTVDPLTLLEQELDRIDARAVELARLMPERRAEVDRVAAAVQREREALVELRASRLVAAPPAARTDALAAASAAWQAVSEAFQVEARLCELGAEVVAMRIEELQRRRAAELERCRAAVAALSPAEAAELVHVAATDLAGEAGSVLPEGSGTAPAAGVAGSGRLAVLAVFRERVDCCLDLVSGWRARLSRSGELPPETKERFRRDLGALRRTRRQAAGAASETETRRRLEAVFGARPVRLFDGLITLLVFAFLGLIVAEWYVPEEYTSTLHWIDLAFCAVFQLDFLVRWGFAKLDGRYFLRHFWLESLPALPYGFIASGAEAFTLLRALRLPRVLRAFRLLVFASRGLDRAVERLRGLLDRDVVVFDPNPLGDSPESPLRRRTLTLEARCQHFVRSAFNALTWDERLACLSMSIAALGTEARVSGALELPYRRAASEARGEIHLERAIHNFLNCDVARVLGILGREGAERLTRFLRLFDVPLVRRLPVLRRVVPAARSLDPAEAISAAANAFGEALQEVLGALRFWGDLSGITTGPQILDRVATAIITATRRPAIRLVVLGAVLWVIKQLSDLFRLEGMSEVFKAIYGGFGLPIVILGLICFALLSLGVWLKRIAGEALGQYLRTADAQFYPLLKARKLLDVDRDMQAIYRSVLEPECRLRCDAGVSDEEWIRFLREPFASSQPFLPRANRPEDPRLAVLADERDVVTLLYRDFLDGPVLHRSDDKTCEQLLGDLTIQEIRAQVLALDSKSRRRLRRLDLERGGALNLGPYFWFRFITESLAVETAKLIMDYNMACIPLAERAFASEEARERFAAFLEERRRGAGAGGRPGSESRQRAFGETLFTGSFTAFDFLGPTPGSDAAVRERYGDEVLECLRRDRRALVRDVFGTRPYHLLPRNERVFNPYRLYRRYLGGAKVVLLPLVLFYGCVRVLSAGVGRVVDLVREVLGVKRVLRSHLSRIAGFDVAVRKINRMRKPFFIEALNLRAALDVEYLGLRLPGRARPEALPTYAEDLDFIGAFEAERRPIERLRELAVRALRELRLCLAARGWLEGEGEGSGGDGIERVLDEIDPTGRLKARRGEVLRAIVMTYVTDHGGLRSLVTAPETVRGFVEEALAEERGGRIRRWCGVLWLSLWRWTPEQRRRRRLFAEMVERVDDLRRRPPHLLDRVRRRFLRADGRVERSWELALSIARAQAGEGGGEDPIDAALRRAAREHALWTRRLVTARTVQALTVLDIRSYRDMVWEVGGYAEE